MDLELINFKHLGGLVRVDTCYNPGSWDNYAMDPELYYAIVINENNEIKSIRVDMALGEKLKQVKPNPNTMAIYNTIIERDLAEKRAIETAKRKAELEKAKAEKQAKSALIGKQVQILKGKNKGFTGLVKWIGETQYGTAALLINNGTKVYTKWTNIKELNK